MARRKTRISPRNQRSQKERHARSKAVQCVADQAMLRGSLVRMERVCGKKNCRCLQGQKHPALFLSVRLGDQRKMIYVPQALEDTVRRWVETGQEVDGWLEAISQECLQSLLAKKEEVLARKRKENPS